jgi:hypothetical protein
MPLTEVLMALVSFAPLLVLAVLLIAGWFPGERAIIRRLPRKVCRPRLARTRRRPHLRSAAPSSLERGCVRLRGPPAIAHSAL